jgi:hypothetical protein
VIKQNAVRSYKNVNVIEEDSRFFFLLLFCLIFCWFFIQAPVSCGLDAMAFEKLKNTNFHVGLDSAAVAAMMATAAAAVDDAMFVCIRYIVS